jgi:transcriptional regulator with XRE-family HTH domain
MKPLHEELKTVRLEKNISLQDISDKMRIKLDFLERIEEGDYSISPMPFLRAFLREYAEAVEIDPQLVMQKFDNKIDSIISTETTAQTSTENEQPQRGDAAYVKIVKQEKTSGKKKTPKKPETPDSEETEPKKKKPRKKTAAKKKSAPKKPKKTPVKKEVPAETEPETSPPAKKEAQTSLFNGIPAAQEETKTEAQENFQTEKDQSAESTEEQPEENSDKNRKNNTEDIPDPEKESNTPEETAPPAEIVKFKQVTIIDDERRREVSKNINSHLSAEKKASDIQFYGVIGIMAATIALIIYLVASGIIF